jgi:hypothetical protein
MIKSLIIYEISFADRIAKIGHHVLKNKHKYLYGTAGVLGLAGLGSASGSLIKHGLDTAEGKEVSSYPRLNAFGHFSKFAAPGILVSYGTHKLSKKDKIKPSGTSLERDYNTDINKVKDIDQIKKDQNIITA